MSFFLFSYSDVAFFFIVLIFKIFHLFSDDSYDFLYGYLQHIIYNMVLVGNGLFDLTGSSGYSLVNDIQWIGASAYEPFL